MSSVTEILYVHEGMVMQRIIKCNNVQKTVLFIMRALLLA
jgi:hypothetical protein